MVGSAGQSAAQGAPQSDSVTGRPAPRSDEDDKDERDDDEDDDEDGLDDEAWLASLPVVESDPEREAERRRALMRSSPRWCGG